jgi:hypothetical protein
MTPVPHEPCLAPKGVKYNQYIIIIIIIIIILKGSSTTSIKGRISIHTHMHTLPLPL